MTDNQTVNTKDSLISAFKVTHDRVFDHFSKISDQTFFSRQPDVWSPADHLEHLLKAVKPMVTALKTPRITLRMMFGKAKESSRNFEEIREIYLGKLQEGARASGRYLPSLVTPQEAAQQKAELLEKWKSASAAMLDAMEDWTEKDLDQYLLPHPILGHLTVREMLFFTLYHDSHHSTGRKNAGDV